MQQIFLLHYKTGINVFFLETKGLYACGGIFNYFDSNTFYRDIHPFFLQLYKEGLIADFDHVVTMWEDEYPTTANTMIIQYDDTTGRIQRMDMSLALSWRVP